MKKQDTINTLLKDNREILLNNESNNAICYDGIVNEEQYANVVVLLKETNGSDANGEIPETLEDWDYCRWLREQQADNMPEKRINKAGDEYWEKNVFYHSTFRKLCYWLSLLFDILENDECDPEKYMDNGTICIEKVRQVLHRVAVVNLKKTWGSSQTDEKILTEYISNPAIRDVLQKQLQELEPKVVLCCSPSVFSKTINLYDLSDKDLTYSEPSQSIKGKNIELMLIGKTVFVSFYHPQYYGKTDKEFSDYAIETFRHVKALI